MNLPLRAILAIILFLLLGPMARAGGSIELSDIQALIEQQPALWKFFTDRLEISSHGVAVRLGSKDSPFRGYRVGPYEFPAKLKGSKGDYDLKITILTDLYFLDGHGKQVLQEEASQKEEVLTDIALGPLETPLRKGKFVQSAK